MATAAPAPIRDLRRASEIVRIVARHGFGWVLRRDRLDEVGLAEAAAPGDGAPPQRPLGERVRALLEDLGPTFIKLGQILSTRPDIVPDAMAEALERLQDGAPRLTLEAVRQVISSELGKPVEELFTRFDPEPLATASIAQVHRARVRQRGEDERGGRGQGPAAGDPGATCARPEPAPLAGARGRAGDRGGLGLRADGDRRPVRGGAPRGARLPSTSSRTSSAPGRTSPRAATSSSSPQSFPRSRASGCSSWSFLAGRKVTEAAEGAGPGADPPAHRRDRPSSRSSRTASSTATRTPGTSSS
jgi:hypothetical protein